jgi:hypothetical protein
VLDETLGALESTLVPIQTGREQIRAAILEAAPAKSSELGIEILDVTGPTAANAPAPAGARRARSSR